MAQDLDGRNAAAVGEDEEELDDSQYKHAKDAVLFMIDVTESMFKFPPQSDEKGTLSDSALSAALKCAYELTTSRIISSPNDMLGVLLHGVDRSRLNTGAVASASQDIVPCRHDYLLVDLCVPSAADVKRLKDYATDEAITSSIVPTSEDKSLANTIFFASRLFSSRAPNFASRRLFIVTDDDNPHDGDDRLKALTTQRAKDLFDLGVTIELFPMVQEGRSFDRAILFNDIIYSESPGDPAAPRQLSGSAGELIRTEGAHLLTSLLTSVRSRIVPKRALFVHVPLEIGPGLLISVKGYIIFKRQEPRRTSYIWIGGSDAKIAIGHSAKAVGSIDQTTAKPEVRKAYKFGGEEVSFSLDEVATIRNFGEPIIRIIGFKGIRTVNLPLWANIKGAIFIVPSEESFVGSTRVFSALHGKMERDGKFAIAWFVARRNAVPQIAAIFADRDRSTKEEVETFPFGLWLVPLPFADDIRDNPDTTTITAPDPLVDKMRQVVQQLQLPKGQYAPEKYPNPALQWHYQVLQAIALEEEAPSHAEDKTVPKYKQIAKRAGGYIEDWGEELSMQHDRWVTENRHAIALPKRGAADITGNQDEVTKRRKTQSGDEVNDEKMKQLVSKNQVNKLTVAELKTWCSGKGLNTTGRKNDLIEQVGSWFEQKE